MATSDAVPGRPVLSLRDALSLNRSADAGAALTVGLACGSTPLHLQNFVRAYAHLARPGTNPEVVTGVYGDVAASVVDLAGHRLDAAVVVLEWPDLDPRLSPRRVDAAVGLRPDDLRSTVDQRLASLERAIGDLAAHCPVAITLPSLPLPVTLLARSGRLSPLEAQLRAALARFAASMAGRDQTRVTRPIEASRDLRSELASDLPHDPVTASALSRDAVDALFPPSPKKGLITDLDDTLWRGLVGEIGADGVCWDLESGAATHALYQHLLGTLAEQGVLLAVVSKNDEAPVAEALARSDLRLPADSLHPVIASWGPKSEAVASVLAAWNIAADDVVFVDDNPAELAEISAQHRAITALRYPTTDASATASLLVTLRDLFAKDTASEDDKLRAASLRSGAAFQAERGDTVDQLDFLRSLGGTIELAVVSATDVRPYELVQKTNQFNLTGARHEPSVWRRMLDEPGRTTVRASYRDRFGDLGTVSVLSGVVTPDGATFDVDCWVLSCRAFARGVEHQVVHDVAAALGADQIRLRFVATARNTAAARFVESVVGPSDGDERGSVDGDGSVAGSRELVVDPQQLAATGLLGVHSVTGGVSIGSATITAEPDPVRPDLKDDDERN